MAANRDRGLRRFDANAVTAETCGSSGGPRRGPQCGVASRRNQDSAAPIVNVEFSATKAPETSEKIARVLLEKTTRILRKRADLTAITVGYGGPEH